MNINIDPEGCQSILGKCDVKNFILNLWEGFQADVNPFPFAQMDQLFLVVWEAFTLGKAVDFGFKKSCSWRTVAIRVVMLIPVHTIHFMRHVCSSPLDHRKIKRIA